MDASVHRMLPEIGPGATLDASVHWMLSETGSDAALYAFRYIGCCRNSDRVQH